MSRVVLGPFSVGVRVSSRARACPSLAFFGMDTLNGAFLCMRFLAVLL